MVTSKAVIYARFSPRRNAEDCASCEKQIDLATKYCVIHKLNVLAMFQDDGLSGATADDRPGLQSALELVKKERAMLVVYSVDRFSRSVKDAVTMMEELKKAKAGFCSVSENFDSTTAMGIFLFQIVAIFAEMNRRQISERTADAMIHHQANGRRMSHLLPYGWKADPDDPARMLPDENELEIIEQAVDLHKSGLSYRKIMAELIEYGYKPRPRTKMFKGKKVTVKGKWYFSTVRNMVKRAESSNSTLP